MNGLTELFSLGVGSRIKACTQVRGIGYENQIQLKHTRKVQSRSFLTLSVVTEKWIQLFLQELGNRGSYIINIRYSELGRDVLLLVLDL